MCKPQNQQHCKLETYTVKLEKLSGLVGGGDQGLLRYRASLPQNTLSLDVFPGRFKTSFIHLSPSFRSFSLWDLTPVRKGRSLECGWLCVLSLPSMRLLGVRVHILENEWEHACAETTPRCDCERVHMRSHVSMGTQLHIQVLVSGAL